MPISETVTILSLVGVIILLSFHNTVLSSKIKEISEDKDKEIRGLWLRVSTFENKIIPKMQHEFIEMTLYAIKLRKELLSKSKKKPVNKRHLTNK